MESKKGLSMLGVVVLILCRGLLPIVAMIFLLIMPSLAPRHLLLGSSIPDWLARVLLTAFFCIHYWAFPRLFEPAPGKRLSVSADLLRDPILLKIYYVFLTLLYTAAGGLLTYIAFTVFLSGLHDARIIAACFNGLIFAVAFALRYPAFKQLAANQRDSYSKG